MHILGLLGGVASGKSLVAGQSCQATIWAWVCSGDPELSTTASARFRLESNDSWTHSRAAKSISLQPRAKALARRSYRGASTNISL